MKLIYILLCIFALPIVGAVDTCSIGGFTINAHNLGEPALSKINVYITVTDDEQRTTNHTVINAICVSDIGNATASDYDPMVWEPYLETVHTTTMGEARFQHDLTESYWNPQTNYTYLYHCYCPDNETVTANVDSCYDEQLGKRIGFISCTQYFPFTSGDDNRTLGADGSSVLWLAAILPMILGFIMLYGSMKMGEENFALKIFFFIFPIICYILSAHMLTVIISRYNVFIQLQQILGRSVYFAVWLLILMLTYVTTYIIIKGSAWIAQKRKEKLEY